MAPTRLTIPLSLATLLLLSTVTCFPSSAAPEPEIHQTGQVTVFWGRHKDEGTLREACDSGMYTTVIMSFLNVSGNNNKYDLDLSGHPLAGIGDDIKHCQHMGVQVSLSIFGTKDSLRTNQSALNLANHIWNAYFGGNGGVHRPFGDARLDGIDFFIEHPGPVTFSSQSHNYYAVLDGKLAGHRIRVTATSRCDSPASWLGTGFGTLFERIHVRYYKDHGRVTDKCDYWVNWAAAYPASRIFLGLPASPEAAKDGYLYPKSLYYGVLPGLQESPNYGGVMLWDRFYDRASNYSSYVKRWA